MKIPPSIKEHLCFQTDVKTERSEQCATSIAPYKVVESILNSEIF